MPHHPLRSPDWIDSAPTVVEATEVIEAPPEAVWAHVVDHEAWPEWFTELDRVEPAGHPTSVGGGRRVTLGGLTLVEELTALEPAERFAFCVVRSPIPVLDSLAERVDLEAIGDGACRVTYRQGVAGRPGCARLVGALWRRASGDALPRALGRLKARAEAG